MVLCRVLLSKVFKWCRQRQEISFSFRAALCTCQLPGLGTQYPGSWSQEAQPCCADFCALQQRKRKSNLEHFFRLFFDVVVHQQQLPNSENFVHFGTIEALVSLGPLFIFHSLIISITQQAVEIVATLMFKKKLLRNRPILCVISADPSKLCGRK